MGVYPIINLLVGSADLLLRVVDSCDLFDYVLLSVRNWSSVERLLG